jgi:hypothetical protein
VQSSPPGLERLFTAIGQVAFVWSKLEAQLDQLLGALLHTPLAGALAIGHSYEVVQSHIEGIVNAEPALGQHDTALGWLSDELRQSIREAISHSRSLAERRNRIIHGVWLPSIGGDHWVNARPHGPQQRMHGERLTIEQMCQVATAIEALANRIELLGCNVDHRMYGLARAPGFDL